MFDELILLAKGGLVAYHGPVKKIEEYFSSIGIDIPDRVNPPDHLIDVLEGIEKPASVTREQLPVRWMLHNGYPIPQDMLDLAEGLSTPSGSDPKTSGGAAGGPSFSGDLPEDAKNSVPKSKDLSNRRTVGILRQYRYFLGRYKPTPVFSPYQYLSRLGLNLTRLILQAALWLRHLRIAY